MLSIALALAAIGVDIGLARLGYGLLLPAIRTDLGGAYAVYGAVGAVHLAGYLAGTIAGTRFIADRAHVPRVIGSAHCLVAAGLAWSAFARDPVALGAARGLVGVASGAGIVAVVTDALERVEAARRGMASSIAWSGIGVGVVLSAPAGQWTIADPQRWRSVTFAFAGAALAVGLAAFALRPHRIRTTGTGRTERAFRWRDLASRRYGAFAGAYTCFGIAYISYATFAVAALTAHGVAGATLTSVWFGYGLAAVAGALATGRVLTSRGHRFALALPLFGGAIGCALAQISGTLAAIAGAFAVGTSLAATPGVASAFARERSDAGTAARAFAAVTICFGCGQMAGPLLAGMLVDRCGLDAAALLGSAIFSIGTALALLDASLVSIETKRRSTTPVPR